MAMAEKQTANGHFFSRLAERATEWSGSTPAFLLAFVVIIVWVITGPIFHYSNTWQLVINTGTTIVTFLMVFLIQRAQNKDSMAMQLKLNEIVAAMEGASNALIGVEGADEEELKTLREHYKTLSAMAEGERRLTESHSVEEARNRHEVKARRRKTDHI
jgi:low affinity Fe/Cu permease